MNSKTLNNTRIRNWDIDFDAAQFRFYRGLTITNLEDCSSKLYDFLISDECKISEIYVSDSKMKNYDDNDFMSKFLGHSSQN